MDAATAAMYEKKVAINGASSQEFYFSKSVAAMPIDSVKIGPTQPCWNTAQSSSAPEQSYYFAELKNREPTCTNQDMHSWNSLELPGGQFLTE